MLRQGDAVELTAKAFDTLLALVEHAGEPVSRSLLLDLVWSDSVVEDATLTQNIYTLRRLLGRSPDGSSPVRTVRGHGYVLELPVRQIEQSLRRIRSLAVLPFRPLGVERDPEVLGLAMADSLITRFSRINGMIVRPTSAIQGFTGPKPEPLETARRLRVDAVVTGSIQQAGERLRITAQLLRRELDSPLCAAESDVTFDQLFEAQDQLAAQLADSLDPGLPERQRSAVTRHETTQPAAYQAYAKGRFFWNKRGGSDLDRAIEAFEQAIAADPEYAQAYAGLADALVLLPFYSGTKPSDVFPKAKSAATKALQIDNRLADAHNSLAYTRFLYDWDFGPAEASFRRALELNPSGANARHWYGFFLSALARHDQALAQTRRAVELDPLSLVIQSDLGMVLYFARKHSEAVEQFRATLELDETFAYGYFGLSLAHSELGDHDAAIAAARSAVRLAPENATHAAALGLVLAKAREPEAAEMVLKDLEKLPQVSPGTLALLHAGLANQGKTIEHLERAIEQRSRFVVFLNVWPAFDFLRGSSELEHMTGQLGLNVADSPLLQSRPATR